jgi:hypothetical protein
MVKPLFLALALTCVAAPACAQATHAAPVRRSAVAPADEYFGRLKMSVLGIANVIKDMRLRVDADADKTPTIFGPLALVEDAIRDWEHKYPHDSWIPRDLLALETTYLHGSGGQAHLMAVRAEAWLRRDYPRTSYATQGRAELVQANAPAAASVPAVPAAGVVPADAVPAAPPLPPAPPEHDP